MFPNVVHLCFEISFMSFFDVKFAAFRLRMEIMFAPKVTILRGMVAICGVCVRYAVNIGSGWGSRGRVNTVILG